METKKYNVYGLLLEWYWEERGKIVAYEDREHC